MLADRAAAWPGGTLCGESSGFTGGAYSHARRESRPYLRCRLSAGSPASPALPRASRPASSPASFWLSFFLAMLNSPDRPAFSVAPGRRTGGGVVLRI